MDQDIRSLPLKDSVLETLLEAGFNNIGDLHGIQPLDLRKETGLTLDDALLVLQYVKNPAGAAGTEERQPVMPLLKRVLITPENQLEESSEEVQSSSTSSAVLEVAAGGINCEPVTMRTLLSKVGRTDSIITFCKSIDTMLGGGVPLGQLTEFVGCPSTGKTQIAQQLCIDVQIPVTFGGLGGRAMYIDTEGSFHPHRIHAMATAMSEHLRKISAIKTKPGYSRGANSAAKAAADQAAVQLRQQRSAVAAECTPEKLLSGIDVCRVHSQTELLAIINTLPSYFSTSSNSSGSSSSDHPRPLYLIVIDSIAFHFRGDIQDTKTRAKLLMNIANKLHELASKHNAAVVVTNHVTTRVGNISLAPPSSSSSTAGPGPAGAAPMNSLQPNTMQVTILPSANATTTGADASGNVTGTGDGRCNGNVSVVSRYDVASRTALVPTLGEQWTRALSTRVLLHWSVPPATSQAATKVHAAMGTRDDNIHRYGSAQALARTATLMKSASVPFGTGYFDITKQGVRDIAVPKTVIANCGSAKSTGKRARQE